ncbi:MAG: FAD-dependent monooxygenase [Gemmataceae bacterium]
MADFTGKRALIIGGGIGGLAAARALQLVGFDAVVCERAPEIREVGAGISLWPNAMTALRRLGLEQPVQAAGYAFHKGQSLDPRGQLLDEMDFTELFRRAGASSVCIHRAELQRILLESVDRARVHAGRECVSIASTARSVTARFADGQEERADLLIGADGIHSVVRRDLFGETPTRYAGYVAWRGIVASDPPGLPAQTSQVCLLPGGHAGALRIGGGRVYWFAARNLRDPEPSGQPVKDEVRGFLASCCAPFQELAAATDETALLRGAILDRPASWPWGNGPVTLLGDAIHATTPNLGQGACQALEDAVVLADALRRAESLEAGLRDYEARRHERTAMVIRNSRSLGRFFQVDSRALCWLRDQFLRLRLGHSHTQKLFAKLFCVELPVLASGGA